MALLLVLLGIVFIAAKLLFASVYLLDHGLKSSHGTDFTEALLFSIQAMATIGSLTAVPTTLPVPGQEADAGAEVGAVAKGRWRPRKRRNTTPANSRAPVIGSEKNANGTGGSQCLVAGAEGIRTAGAVWAYC
jgi:hypothetical protein